VNLESDMKRGTHQAEHDKSRDGALRMLNNIEWALECMEFSDDGLEEINGKLLKISRMINAELLERPRPERAVM
jgi:hypothetical protein